MKKVRIKIDDLNGFKFCSGWMPNDYQHFEKNDFFKMGYGYDYIRVLDEEGNDVMIPGSIVRKSIIIVEELDR